MIPRSRLLRQVDPAPTGATAATFSENRYGGPITHVLSSPAVTTTAQRILVNNPKRVHWLVVNRGANNIAVDFNEELTYAGSFPLGAEGGVASSDVEEDGETVARPLWAISQAGTNSLRVLEVVRV